MQNQNRKENVNEQAGRAGNNGAEFKPGDKVRFKSGFDKTFGGSEVYTVESVKKETCEGCKKEYTFVRLKEFGLKFQSQRLVKVEDKLGGAKLWDIIEKCLGSELCDGCELADQRADCKEIFFAAIHGAREQQEEDIKAYKQEIAVLHTALQWILGRMDCVNCPEKVHCIARKRDKKEIQNCITQFRATASLVYDCVPNILETELSGDIYNKKGGDKK